MARREVESFYFVFGNDDFYILADLPGPAEVAALSLAVGDSGAMSCPTVVLVTPEELDAATKLKTVSGRRHSADTPLEGSPYERLWGA